MSQVPETISQLVERFENDAEHYRSPAYNETLTRVDFINPMFKAMGWDMDNTHGYADAYRDVIHEDAIKIGGDTKAPDYCFRIGGTRKFFLEAKKPGVNIRKDPAPAFQLRRYAWSAKLPLSVLTDFEEFAVYDCRVKPDKFDKPSVARVFYCSYDQYPEKWPDIAGIFARESILKGSFDKYAETAKKKRGTAEVDEAFLSQIESFRELLARNIALRNKLSQRDLNFAVQRTIDRIIFLRICEDRGIEVYANLRGLLNGPRIYKRLCELYDRADERYNSGLFHFRKEKDRHESPDELTPSLEIDDRVLKEIIASLYYPDSPYEFSVIGADILGQVYEQFLGKVIHLSAGGRAKIEEKPEVRKAGGVYYTPTYIVDYIVANTVGKLVEGKTPKEVAKIRVLDPACGSGSFLIGAYHFLLDWHLKWYMANDPEAHARGKKPAVYRGRGGWRLTTAARKQILLNNIYGVDIDNQAVEVTKLSLLLKVLEGETGEGVNSQLRLFHERALPDLGDNIKCGNSLIGPDFYDNEQMLLLDDEEKLRVNVFDWNREFAPIMKAGGFDAVIGNPPYIRIQTLQETAPETLEYYKNCFVGAGKGNYDIYILFVERGLALLNKTGLLGFILPHKFFNASYGEPLRTLVAKGRHLSRVVHFSDQQVFTGATTYTCLLFLERAGADGCYFSRVSDLGTWRVDRSAEDGRIDARTISGSEWNFALGKSAALLTRLNQTEHKLKDVAERMGQGIRTSANEVYVLDLVSQGAESHGDFVVARSQLLNKDFQFERDSVLLFLQGREIKPYRIKPSGKVVVMPYKVNAGRAELIREEEFRNLYPSTWNYLCLNKSHLERREKGRFAGSSWYMYGRQQNIDLMLLPKILVPDIADRAAFAWDQDGEFAFTSGYGITLRPTVSESPQYLLALLNSSLLDFCLKAISTPMRGGFFRYFTQFIGQLPIARLDCRKKEDHKKHGTVVALVDQMLKLHRRLGELKPGHEREALQRQIDATDAQIDRLVYELYGLTDQEIRIVEEATAGG